MRKRIPIQAFLNCGDGFLKYCNDWKSAVSCAGAGHMDKSTMWRSTHTYAARNRFFTGRIQILTPNETSPHWQIAEREQRATWPMALRILIISHHKNPLKTRIEKQIRRKYPRDWHKIYYPSKKRYRSVVPCTTLNCSIGSMVLICHFHVESATPDEGTCKNNDFLYGYLGKDEWLHNLGKRILQRRVFWDCLGMLQPRT